MSDWIVHLGGGLAAATLLMAALWLAQLRTRNAGIVDVGWALGIGAMTAAFAALAPGDPLRRLLIAGITGVWSLRLGLHLAHRVASEPEDGRYQALREWAGPRAQPVLLAFFLLQATWVVLFAMPPFVAARNAQPLGWTDAVACLVFAISIAGETHADRQLSAFRRDPANRGRVCRTGWWRYSRHPNYFFEWLHWFAYPLLAFGAGPVAMVTLLGPVAMLYLLLRVTGVPPTEARALRSRGSAYRAYQATTSAFFPWPPREEAG